MLLGGRWHATDEARERDGVEALDGTDEATELARDKEGFGGSGAAGGAMAQPKREVSIDESGGSSVVSDGVGWVKTSPSSCPASLGSVFEEGRTKEDIVDRSELSWFVVCED